MSNKDINNISRSDSDQSAILDTKNTCNQCSLRNPLLEEKQENELDDSQKLMIACNYQEYIWLRWIIASCLCLMQVIRFFCYDNAQALQTHFQSGNLKLTTTQFNLLYSIQSYLLIFPFIAGYISDHFSIRKLMFIMVIFQLIGQMIFTLGAYIESFPVLLTGRWIFIIAGVSMEIYEDHLLSIWFAKKEMFFAMGAGLSCCRLGTSLTNYFTPKIYDDTKLLYLPLLYGCYMYIFGVLIVLILIFVDHFYRGYIILDGNEEENQNDIPSEDISNRPLTFIGGIFFDLKRSSKLFWLIVVAGTMSYVIFDVFENNSNDMIGGLFSLSNVKMGNVLFGAYLYAGIFMPLFGYFVDKKGNRLNFQIFSCVMAVLPIALLAFLPRETNTAWISVILVLFMTFQSMYGVIFWAMIPYVTPDFMLGTGFGTVYTIQNFFLLSFSLVIGEIRDNTLSEKGGWFWCLIFFIMIYLADIVLQFFIASINYKKDNFLNKVSMKYSAAPDKETLTPFAKIDTACVL